MMPTRRGRTDERWGFWVSAILLGTALGTLGYYASTGIAHGSGAAPGGVVGWLGFLAVRGLFLLITQDRLARLGWSVGIVVAVLVVMTPLGNPGLPLWFARLALVVGSSGLVLFATARRVPGWQPWTVAAAAVVGSLIIRIVNLDSIDAAAGPASVVTGW